MQGRIQNFKLGGGACLKKLRRAEGGAKILGVFRVKNHDFTPKNHIFSNCGGRREKFWGISCEKSRLYAKKSYLFQFQGGARAGGAPPPPLDPPLRWVCGTNSIHIILEHGVNEWTRLPAKIIRVSQQEFKVLRNSLKMQEELQLQSFLCNIFLGQIGK